MVISENGKDRSEKRSIFQRSYLLQAWLGILLALVFGIALAGVQTALGPVIETNKINETREKVPELVLGEAAVQKMAAENQSLTIEPRSVETEKNGRKKLYNAYLAKYPDGRMAGWVTKAHGMGYADRIELLIGLDPKAEKITGLFILDQKETPGLGSKITEKPWRAQFLQKGTARPLAVVKGKAGAAYDINAVSGATISSRSVADIVNRTVDDLKGQLALQMAADPKDK